MESEARYIPKQMQGLRVPKTDILNLKRPSNESSVQKLASRMTEGRRMLEQVSKISMVLSLKAKTAETP